MRQRSDSSTPFAGPVQPFPIDMIMRLRALGYDPIPIVPPEGELAASSSLDPADRGKVPGRLNNAGTWGSWNWRTEPLKREVWKRSLAAGAGIGIKGEGVLALDIDIDHELLAKQVAAVAASCLGEAPERVGRPPRRMLIYGNPEGFAGRCLRIRLPDGEHQVDLRGTGQQFVAYGMHPSGRAYRWTDAAGEGLLSWAVDDLPVFDGFDWALFQDEVEELVRQYGGSVELSGTGAAGREDVDQAALAAPEGELAALADALSQLPNELETRDDWVRMGAAIKATFAANPELGEDAFTEWSRRWPGNATFPEGNSDRAIRATWAGLKPPFEIGVSWLKEQLRAARLEDVSHVFPVVEGYVTDRQAARAAQLRADQSDFWHGFVYVAELERFVNLEMRTLWRDSQFSRFWQGKLEKGSKASSGKDSAAETWRLSTAGLRVDGITYRPGAGILVTEGSQRCLNMWRPGPIVGWLAKGGGREVLDSEVALWLDLVAHLLPDRREQGLLMDWLAFQLQRPGEKCNWHPLLWGGQGIGKDTLLAPVMAALGENAAEQPADDLGSNWNDWVLYRQLVVLEEVYTQQRKAVSNSVKVLLSAPPHELTVNQKYQHAFKVPNLVNVVMLSNHPDALVLEEDDRRVAVFHGRTWGTVEERVAFFHRLWEWYGQGGLELVARWLAGRPLTAFNPKGQAPMTDAKREMVALSLPVGESLLRAWIEEQEGMFARDLVTAGDVMDALAGAGYGKLSPHRIGLMLTNAGAVAMPNPIRLPSSPRTRLRMWALRRGEWYMSMAETARVGRGGGVLGELYEKQLAVHGAADRPDAGEGVFPPVDPEEVDDDE